MKKTINNQICAANGCTKVATEMLNFQIGFCANFCAKCADTLTTQNLGVEKAGTSEQEFLKNGMTLVAVEGPAANVKELSSQGSTGNDNI